MEKVALFVDYANINKNALENNYQINYKDLAEYVSEGRFLMDAFIYLPLNPRNPHANDKEKLDLWSSGYLIKEKMGTLRNESYKCNMDIEMAMDILNLAYTNKPDTIVLASGDSDFIPLIIELRKMGIRVEVAAFKSCAAKELIVKCSGFIDLDLYYEGTLEEESYEDNFGDEIDNFRDEIQDEEEFQVGNERPY